MDYALLMSNCIVAKQEFFGASFVEMVERSYESQATYKHPYIPWKIWFPQAIWLIWLHINYF